MLVTAGATEAIAAALLALLEPGDEVVAFEPFYDSYAAGIAMAGATRVPLTLRAPDFRPDLDRLRSLITPRTRLPGTDQRNRLGAGDRAPACLGGLDELECHREGRGWAARATGDPGAELDPGERRLDRVGGPLVDPVRGREVVERQPMPAGATPTTRVQAAPLNRAMWARCRYRTVPDLFLNSRPEANPLASPASNPLTCTFIPGGIPGPPNCAKH